jgi:hypothetical protein
VEYRLVQDSSANELTSRVHQHLRDGWELQGGIAHTPGCYSQAMIKRNPTLKLLGTLDLKAPETAPIAKNKKYGYVCGTDFEEDVGKDTVTVYPKFEDAAAKLCAHECGIYEVEVSLVRVAQEPKKS